MLEFKINTADLPSTTASIRSKRRHIEEREVKMDAVNRALEEATRLNQEHKTKIQKRLQGGRGGV